VGTAGTGPFAGRFFGMRSGLSFDHIFPIRSDASARLMRLKADCLLAAGVIDTEDRLQVYAQTGMAVAMPELVGLRVARIASHQPHSLPH